MIETSVMKELIGFSESRIQLMDVFDRYDTIHNAIKSSLAANKRIYRIQYYETG